MLRLPATELPAATQAGLAQLQTEIDALASYEERVEAAKTEFSKRNKGTNPIFREVRATLGEMAGGLLRCADCEDSMADEVEHIRPKDLYPDAVFRWTNYLYACGPCNGPKNNGFAIVEQGGGSAVATSVSRKRTDPVLPPRDGLLPSSTRGRRTRCSTWCSISPTRGGSCRRPRRDRRRTCAPRTRCSCSTSRPATTSPRPGARATGPIGRSCASTWRRSSRRRPRPARGAGGGDPRAAPPHRVGRDAAAAGPPPGAPGAVRRGPGGARLVGLRPRRRRVRRRRPPRPVRTAPSM